MNVLVLDVETTVKKLNGTNDNSPFNEENRLVSVHYKWDGSYYDAVFYHIDKRFPDSPNHFRKCLSKADIIVAHNAKFDVQWLLESGFKIEDHQKVYCTMIGEYIFARGQRPELSLEKTAIRRGVTQKKSDLIDDLFKSGIGFEEIPLETVLEYAQADVQSCAEIYEKQQEELKNHPGLIPTFNLMNEMLMFLVSMEKNGIMIDSRQLDKVEHQFLEERSTIERLLKTILSQIMGDRPINLNSGADMSKVIYSLEIKDKDLHKGIYRIGVDARGKPNFPPNYSQDYFERLLRDQTKPLFKQVASHCRACNSIGTIRKIKKDGTPYKNVSKCESCKGLGAHYTDTGDIAGLRCKPRDSTYASINGFKTDKITLGHLLEDAKANNNVIAIKFLGGIIRLHAVNTYLNSFVNGIKTYKRKDNILHANFNQTVTATGRLSSSHPNFQNQPKSGKFPVRQCIVSRFEGGLILEADYSGLEFRVAGEISKDQQIIDDIKNGKDIHTQTATIINQTSKDKITKELRSSAKAHSFAPLYGATGTGQKPHVKKYYEEFFKIYKGVKKWHNKLCKKVVEDGVISIPSGREFAWKNPRMISKDRVTNHTQVVNYPVQSFATADIVPLACVRALKLFKKLKLKSKLILTVHDSIVVDVYPSEIEAVKNCITVAMKHINTDMKKRWNYEPSIALDIEMAIGKNWMEMSEI